MLREHVSELGWAVVVLAAVCVVMGVVTAITGDTFTEGVTIVSGLAVGLLGRAWAQIRDSINPR